jgi:uncharacterized membrane protein YgdD (TMEM256/DUF423 family)
MGKINYGRAIMGGLVAGLILNIGEFLFNGVIMANAMREWGVSHNLPAEPTTTFMVAAIGLTFALGILMVMLYAMIRPRYGPGPKTALCAALILWFGICVYCGIIYTLLLEQPTKIIGVGLVWCLGEYVIAAIAGAWLYKEA